MHEDYGDDWCDVDFDEEEDLRSRLEAGDIAFGSDPIQPLRLPVGSGYYAQLFRAIYGAGEECGA